MDLAYEQADWEPTPAAEALLRNNLPLLAYIAGKPEAFTSKDHLFVPGETFEKQLIVINNSRRTVECDCTWSLDLPNAITGSKQDFRANGRTGAHPADIRSAAVHGARASTNCEPAFKFSNGEMQEDSFVIHVLPRP